MKNRIVVLLFTFVTLSPASLALNIVLSNDDGWNTRNIGVLKAELEKAGHDVILSCPCAAQSGKGGAMMLFKPLPVDRSRAESEEYCVGDTDGDKSFSEYSDGTPVIAALYGIDILAQEKWGRLPDLVISGPNEGNNLGMGNNNSGTLGVAMIAIGKGVPAVAVSAHHNSQSDATVQEKIADVVLTVISTLEKSRTQGQPLLPQFTGLNVNLPEHVDDHKGFRLTKIGWNSGMELSFTDDMSKSRLAMVVLARDILKSGRATSMEQALTAAGKEYAGVNGVVVAAGNNGDDNPDSEAAALAEGYITISIINGNVQASERKAEHMGKRLSSLFLE